MSDAVLYQNSPNEFQIGREGEKVTRIPAGMYSFHTTPFARLIRRTSMVTDELINLESSNTQDVIAHINRFLLPETRTAFKNYGLLYRQGILLYGPPGTGKTSTVIQICRKFIEDHDGIVITSARLEEVAGFVRDIRLQDKERCVLLLLEELDEKLDYNESEILNLLDGQSSVDNFIVLASTNYIDKIPPRIKNRPSRFALLKEIGYPGAETRRAFLAKKILPADLERTNLEHLVRLTEGFTIDHLKDLVINIFCFNASVEDAVTKLREMIELSKDEDDDDE